MTFQIDSFRRNGSEASDHVFFIYKYLAFSGDRNVIVIISRLI